MKQDEAKKLKNLLTFVAKGMGRNKMKLDESQGLLIPIMKPMVYVKMMPSDFRKRNQTAFLLVLIAGQCIGQPFATMPVASRRSARVYISSPAMLMPISSGVTALMDVPIGV